MVAAALLPAVAQAAPVNPSQAVLAAHEFPFGSTGYKVEREVLKPDDVAPDAPADATSPCAVELGRTFEKLAGVTVVEAEVTRAGTELEAAVMSRRVTDYFTATFRACNAQMPPRERASVLPVPADLAGRGAFVFRDGDEYIGWTDVRDVTVTVYAEAKDKLPVDAEAFWQTFRAQVAKVERQP
ncbi:hypothetical protein [Tsukamurella sp. 1534]|uniref:hypothetical protein n=1 Tax=Tsukamurella sp. 1534 TaxID=1151061 RepID=UPI00131EEC9D|nr:hypothetical protein [Tsukamurella sp. 1534]